MSDRTQPPLIGLTLGDPTGVGPEVVAKAMLHDSLHARLRPVAIGSASALERIIEICGLDLAVRTIGDVRQARFEPGTIDTLDIWNQDHRELPFKQVTAAGGEAAVTAVIEAVKLCAAGRLDAMATSPLHKLAMKMAGYDYPGHTEIVQEFSGAKTSRMMLVAGKLRVIHVSTHVGLAEAVTLVKTDRIVEVIGDFPAGVAGHGHRIATDCGRRPQSPRRTRQPVRHGGLRTG